MNTGVRWGPLLSGAVFVLGLIVVFLWPSAVWENATDGVSTSAVCANISPDISLIANAAYAKDLKTGITLYEKNADAQLPLASLTKLATVATASHILSGNDLITISKEAIAPEGNAGFRIGEAWKTDDLIDYTLMTSANDGARAIALAAAAKEGKDLEGFIQEMNDMVRTLGMVRTFFASDIGLDISSTTASAYGSAYDVATLMASVMETNPRLLEGTSAGKKTFTSLSGYTHTAENTSDLIDSLGGVVALKTGYTDLAGGNLAIVFESIPGRPVVAVVLGSTRLDRDADMQTLVNGAKTALKRAIVCGNGSGPP